MKKKVLYSLISLGLITSFYSSTTLAAEITNTTEIKNLWEQQSEKQVLENKTKLYPEIHLNETLKNMTTLENTDFKPSSITASSDYLIEQEYNDDFGYADLLPFNKPILGQFLDYEDVDIYKIVVPRDGMIGVGGWSNTYAIDLLYGVFQKDFVESSKLKFLGYEYEEDMEIQYYQAKAGTYYVVATDEDFYYYNWNDNTQEDLYVITTAFVDNVAPGKPTVNKVDNNDVKVTGKAEANSTVTVKKGTTVLSTVKATSTGTFSAKIAVQKAGSVLKINAKDSAGNSSAGATVTVADVIAPAKPVIYKVDSNDLKVTGKAEANSTVTVKVGTKTLGYAKATSTGSYSVPIKAQKRGVILTVTAKDKAGNTSSKASITVVKP